MTLPQRALSLRASVRNSAAVPGVASKPKSANSLVTFGFVIALFNSAFSRATTSGGMPAGPMRPWNATALTSLTPCSAKVGSSGIAFARCGRAIASARTFPALMVDRPDAKSNIITFTCPPITSCSAGAAPLYGTCVIVKPACCLNNSIAMW